MGLEKVVKRNGEVQEFKKENITEAIWQAAKAVGGRVIDGFLQECNMENMMDDGFFDEGVSDEHFGNIIESLDANFNLRRT